MRTQLTNIKDREYAQMYKKKTFPVSMSYSRQQQHFDKDGVVF